MIRFGWKLRGCEGVCEGEPGFGGVGADAVEVFGEVGALEVGEGEGCVGEDGALGGVEAVGFEVFAGDLDVGWFGSWEGDVAEEVGV